jgi:polyphosphate kinase
MDRNLDRRVEAVVPIEDPDAANRIGEIIRIMLADDRRSWQLGTDAAWRRTEELNGTDGTFDTFAEMKRIALEGARETAQPHRPGAGVGSLDPRA